MGTLVQKFSEHYHDAWAQRKIESGWGYADYTLKEKKKHERLKPFAMLTPQEKEFYRDPITSALQALISLRWQIEYTEAEFSSNPYSSQRDNQAGVSIQSYNPSPADMSNLTLSKEMMNLAERLAEDAHDRQALIRKQNLEMNMTGQIDLTIVPYDLLTDSEKMKNRERCQELLKYIQYEGYKLSKVEEEGQSDPKSKKDNRFAHNLLEKLVMYLDTSAPNMKLLKPSNNFSRRSSYVTTNQSVKFFTKVVLPLLEKYFYHHRIYFTSVATTTTAAGVATIKEKESVANLFCKLANLLRLRQSAFGSDVKQAVRCLQVLVKAIDAKSLAKSRPEFVRTSMLLYFNNCADDLEKTIINLQEGKYPHLRGSHLKTCTSFKYVFEILVPVLVSTFDHLALYEYGHDLLRDEIQVACYKIIESLYTIGTNLQLTKARRFLRSEIAVHRASIGTCLAALSSTFPVAFLEPTLNHHNPSSVMGSGFAKRSLEAQEVVARLEQSVPTLEQQLAEIDKFLEENHTHQDHPHIIDVLLPFLCSYLPSWWLHGPDNVDPKDGGHITMVTSEHLNHLLRNILRLIMKHVGDENAEWMTNIAVHAQQIIIATSEELLRNPILPLAEKCRQRVDAMFHKEEGSRAYLKAAADDASQVEGEIQEEWNLIVRDIYAFYPLLIKYVDSQKQHWIKNNVEDAEHLYNHVGEIFNNLTISAVS